MQTRRAFLGTSLTAAAGVVAGLSRLLRAAPPGRPNVLLVVVDDMNDWVGCLGGHPDARTPHIDRLAARGVVFTRAYCNAPSCNPSRASLLTGIRPSTSGVYDNRQPFRLALPDALTLQQSLMAGGYRAVGRGKIFHGRYPDPASWNEYVPAGPSPEPPERLHHVLDAAHFDWGPLDVPDDAMDDMKVVGWCAEKLSRRRDEPLLLACGLNTPHLPWYVPRPWFERFPPERITLPRVREDDLEDVPPAGRRFASPQKYRRFSEEDWRGAVAGYLASIAFTDAAVGRLMQAFDASPYRDDTVIVFLGDQGWHLGEKLHWRKFSLWEESTRVPLLVVAPGLARPGQRCDRTVSFIDLYPTLCDLCGVPAPPGLEGLSLRPLLEDATSAWERPAITTSGRGNHSVRSERWRYIRYRDGSEELYDHDHDPLEWRNLAAEPKLSDVKHRLAAWLPRTDAPDAPHESEEAGAKPG